MLAVKFGAAGAATFAHLIVGPLAAGFIAYKIKNLPKDLGKSISNGVKEDLEGNFRSMTQKVIEGMKNEVCNMDAMAAAVVGEIITVEGWERHFENADSSNPAVAELNHEVVADGYYAGGIYTMMKGQVEVPAKVDEVAPPAYQADMVDLEPLEEMKQEAHLNQCLSRQGQGNRLVHCWVCLESLVALNEDAVAEHLNVCLNRRAPRTY